MIRALLAALLALLLGTTTTPAPTHDEPPIATTAPNLVPLPPRGAGDALPFYDHGGGSPYWPTTAPTITGTLAWVGAPDPEARNWTALLDEFYAPLRHDFQVQVVDNETQAHRQSLANASVYAGYIQGPVTFTITPNLIQATNGTLYGGFQAGNFVIVDGGAYCAEAVVLHEFGHLYGLEHGPGIMNPDDPCKDPHMTRAQRDRFHGSPWWPR